MLCIKCNLYIIYINIYISHRNIYLNNHHTNIYTHYYIVCIYPYNIKSILYCSLHMLFILPLINLCIIYGLLTNEDKLFTL